MDARPDTMAASATGALDAASAAIALDEGGDTGARASPSSDSSHASSSLPLARPSASSSPSAPSSSSCCSSSLPTIFVSLISYRDSETRHTVSSLFSRARHPERVFVGVVWQYSPEEDARLLFDGFRLDDYPPNHVRQVFMRHTDARGPCLARSIAMEQLYGTGAPKSGPGEDFYLQLDSHMRFADGWDAELVDQWHACQDAHAVLTAYPPGYERTATNALDQANNHEATVPPPLLCASHFDENDGMLRFVGRWLQPPSQPTAGSAAASPLPPARPLPSLFYAAGFCFGPGSLVRSCPYDPSLTNLFFGEETAMLARLWTAGFNMYHPTRNVVWHCWSRAYRPSFRENAMADPVRAAREEARARRKVQRLLGMAPMPVDEAILGTEASVALGDASQSASDARYSLGSVRTLAAFQAHVGVDFARRTVSARAKNAGLEADQFKPPVSEKKAQQMEMVMRLVMQQQQASKPA